MSLRHPGIGSSADPALLAAYQATRAILRAPSGPAAQAAVLQLCRDLGGEVVAADDLTHDTVPIDMSVGEGEPLLPASPDPEIREALGRYLSAAIADARLVAERGLRSELLQESASRDALTGLWSRRPLTRAINRAAQGDCVALIDLDHFKSVNDDLGHDAGDALLQAFGQHLRAAVRDADVVGRLGGEEFVILLPGTPLERAVAVLDRVRRTWPPIAPQPVTFSAGVAAVPHEGADGDRPGQHALRRADKLMYQAKQQGRNQTRW